METLDLNILEPIEIKLFNALNQEQQNALMNFPNEAYLYFDWTRNGQVPEGTKYQDVELYVNGDRMVRLVNGEVTGDVGEVPDDFESTVVWADGECVLIDIGDTIIMDRTRLSPIERLDQVAV